MCRIWEINFNARYLISAVEIFTKSVNSYYLLMAITALKARYKMYTHC